MNYLKQPTYRSEKWLRAVASIECVHCMKEGTQAAHRNQGKGMSIKTDDCLTASLCPEAHAMIDQGSSLTREERRGLMDQWILATIVQLARRGLIRVV